MEHFLKQIESDGMFNVIKTSIKQDGWSYCDVEIVDHDTRGASEVLTMWAHSHGAKVAGFDVNDNGNIEVTVNKKQ